MTKLRFDPVNYQFYYRCSLEDGGLAKAAGFRWDALRRRYYTIEPRVAAVLANRGDDYVKLLLADALEATVQCKPAATDTGSRCWPIAPRITAISSNSVH